MTRAIIELASEYGRYGYRRITIHRDGLADQSQKAEFEKLVRELIEEHDITFIGDDE